MVVIIVLTKKMVKEDGSVMDSTSARIPKWVDDLETFRRWVHSEDSPDAGHFSFFNGEIWVDLSNEQFTHNQVKGETGSVLTRLAKRFQLGRYFAEGYLLSNMEVGLSTNPDGMFALTETFRSGRVRLVEGAEEVYVELQGTPDMVLEVISPSSVHKDTVVLRDLYWQVGIDEYWLVDVRGAKLEFTILRHGRRGYIPIRKQSGWIKSSVFGKAFQLTQRRDVLGYPEYTLGVR
jgi:Uma2 family endonuclease